MSHRIIYEYDLIEKLKIIEKKKKFTEEILWRLYWKGYLKNINLYRMIIRISKSIHII
tara:strand:- start:1070 stop:1243 length:174 start_codon:yes stop_codon:yes gene_type:complete